MFRDLTLVTLDFETYYDRDYSLTKLSTSDYINDQLFKAHMVGIKINGGVTEIRCDVEVALAEIDWEHAALLCQHTQFDAYILTQIYKHTPAYYLDTLSMARAYFGVSFPISLGNIAEYLGLPGKLEGTLIKSKGIQTLTTELEKQMSRYCAQDVNITYDAFQIMVKDYPDDELDLINLTVRMFAEPVLQIDQDLVTEEHEAEMGGKVAKMMLANAMATQLASAEQFAELIRDKGVVPPTKRSPTTGHAVYAFAKTDVGFQLLLKNPATKALAEARLAVKSSLGETRALRFRALTDKNLPVYLAYCGAHTHRWSGGNSMNLQNLPRKGRLRRSIIAPPGYVIVVGDSAQIEARVLAWLAGQSDLLELFAAGKDVYKHMAMRIFTIEEEQVTEYQRFLGKVLVLGLGFGMGAVRLRATLAQGMLGHAPVDISENLADRYVEIYRMTNYQIPLLWKSMEQMMANMLTETSPTDLGPLHADFERIEMPSGLNIHYPELRGSVNSYDGRLVDASYVTRGGTIRIWGGFVTENVVQSLARDIVAAQMLKISRKYRVVMFSHDEIVVIAKEDEAQEAQDFVLSIMGQPPDWAKGLPLAAEGSCEKYYSK